MGFNNSYDIAVDRNQQLSRRVSKMRSCILRFARLIDQRFVATSNALAPIIGYHRGDMLDEAQVEKSLQILKQEREAYLHQLERFAALRKENKPKGHRHLSQRERESLQYRGVLRVINGERISGTAIEPTKNTGTDRKMSKQ